MVSIYFAAVYPLPEEDVHHFYEEGGREESLRWRGNANGAKNVDKKKKRGGGENGKVSSCTTPCNYARVWMVDQPSKNVLKSLGNFSYALNRPMIYRSQGPLTRLWPPEKGGES